MDMPHSTSSSTLPVLKMSTDPSSLVNDHSIDAESQLDVTLEDHVRFFTNEVARLREDLLVETADAQNDFMVSDSIFTYLTSS